MDSSVNNNQNTAQTTMQAGVQSTLPVGTQPPVQASVPNNTPIGVQTSVQAMTAKNAQINAQNGVQGNTPSSLPKQSNIIVDFFLAWFYILLYALRGVKFLLIDIWSLIFSSLSLNFDVAIKEAKTDEMKDSELLYERTSKRRRKVKQYRYSPKKLARYDKMKEELAKDLQASGATRSKVPNMYQYIVRDIKGNGKIITDTMPGFSKLDINSFLVNQGYEVYSIKTSSFINFVYKDSSLLGRKMSMKDLVFTLTQLATYLRAGITLNDSVRIMSQQFGRNKSAQKVFKSLCYELSLGESFSNALAKQGNYFPALLINMLKAAEATGTLQETLDDMVRYYTEVNSTRKEMRSALIYPAVITVFATGVVTFIIVYVVPQFTQIYTTNGLEIKGLTGLVIKMSDFLQHNILWVFLALISAIILVFFLYKKVKAVRIQMQILIMHLPVFKDLVIYKELNIFAKTFASLLRNNIYITDSIDILSKITENEIFKSILFRTINNIIKGDKISEAFKDHWAVPQVAYFMIVTGESTGQLADMMQRVSDYYQEQHKNMVAALKSLIEPIMIVFLAVIVGGILLAVMVPMFSMYDQIM